jgi:hypothetical protein
MAIQTVTNENVAEYVAERKARGSVINDAQNPGNIPKVEGVATPGNPIIKEGIAETLPDAPPDPGKLTPTAKPKNPVQPRIDELTREKYELEEFAQGEYELRLRAERRISELEAGRPNVEVKPEPELKRPSPKDFTDQALYDQAMDEYDAKRDEKTAARAAAMARQEALTAEQDRQLAARIATAKTDLPDFQAVIERADKRTREEIPSHIKAVIVESEKGAYIAYHLAKNPDEERRIFALSPTRALLELGKIEETYATKEKPSGPIPEISKAPPPMSSVKGEGGGIVTTDLSAPQPFQAYKQARLEQIRARKRH